MTSEEFGWLVVAMVKLSSRFGHSVAVYPVRLKSRQIKNPTIPPLRGLPTLFKTQILLDLFDADMADILTFCIINDIFADVARTITYALQGTRDPHYVQ